MMYLTVPPATDSHQHMISKANKNRGKESQKSHYECAITLCQTTVILLLFIITKLNSYWRRWYLDLRGGKKFFYVSWNQYIDGTLLFKCFLKFFFLYVWPCWVFLIAGRLLSSCGEWGFSLAVVHELLVAAASLVEEQRLRAQGLKSYDSWA